jgi:hypothetical protein
MEAKESIEREFKHEDGVTYFTKRIERRVLFIMTVGMLLWGAIEYAREIF